MVLHPRRSAAEQRPGDLLRHLGQRQLPGASVYTNAEIFDMDDPEDAAEYAKRVKEWESQPEWVEVEEEADTD